MKLVSFRHAGQTHYGAVKNGKVIDLSARMGGQYPDINSFIAHDGIQVAKSIVDDGFFEVFLVQFNYSHDISDR